MAMKSVVATLGPPHDKPWWWKHLSLDRNRCQLDYVRVVYNNRHSQDISTIEIPIVMLKVLRYLMTWRRLGYSHVFTVECDLVGFSIAFWQSVTGMRRPKHVIVQFIMREKQDTARSRAKYALMRFLFSSLHHVVVSSTLEMEYYRKVFCWPVGKAVFVPVLTAPELLDKLSASEDQYYLAAGRSFRDYETLIRAVAGTSLRVLIVGGRGTVKEYAGLANVRTMENIPASELEGLMLRSRAVVVPLEDRAISIGQSVVLQAMALGKAVVATRTAGTIDYIDHMNDGMLVAPGDERELRDALVLLESADLRRKLGTKARSRVAMMHLPKHYAESIRKATAV
jgi:glycosyltransferase involved in cell wall biosynthesis